MSDSTAPQQTRTEQDSMGQMEVPHEALYGATTQRALGRFAIAAVDLEEQL